MKKHGEDIRMEKEKFEKIPCLICLKDMGRKDRNVSYINIICDNCREALQKLIKALKK